MKPFDLEAAKRGDPVVTRDGRKVLDLHHFERDKSNLCLCAHIEGEGSPDWFHANGRDNLSDEDPSDLFMAPKKRTVYVNLHKQRDTGELTPFLYDDGEYAERQAGNSMNCLGTFPIEIED